MASRGRGVGRSGRRSDGAAGPGRQSGDRDGRAEERGRAETDGSRRSGRSGEVDRERGVFMISVAAELAGMHPQTLRIYEARGLITPKRSPRQTRLYSQADVERLRRIQELTSELGMNLAGVERVFELERELERMRARIRTLERQAERLERELDEGIEKVRRSYRRELVRYEDPGQALVPARGQPGVRVRISRGRG